MLKAPLPSGRTVRTKVHPAARPDVLVRSIIREARLVDQCSRPRGIEAIVNDSRLSVDPIDSIGSLSLISGG